MKIILSVAVACLVPLTFLRADSTYLVEEDQAPWRDRNEGERVIVFHSVPESLRGRGPFKQGSCGSRSVEIPADTGAVLIGVEKNKDLQVLRELYPTLVDTEEPFTLRLEQGGTIFYYTVISIAEPPPTLVGNVEGYQPLVSGLIYLGADDVENRPRPDASGGGGMAQVAFSPARDRSNFHIYLMMGQSNMLGRDDTGMRSQPVNPYVAKLLRNGEWTLAREPLSPNSSGVGPGISFANHLLKGLPEGTRVGLVQLAVGGTALERWEEGQELYTYALQKAKEAAATGTLKGILWHQGENDALRVDLEYQERLARMLTRFRAELGQPELPIVVGQIGDFVTTPGADTVRAAIREMPARLPNVGYADSTGLRDQGDRLHFSAAAQGELGKRFAQKMLELQAPR